VDLSAIKYPAWADYAQAFNIEWQGEPAKLKPILHEELPDNNRLKVGLCCWSRDKFRSYPHWKALKKRLAQLHDVYLLGKDKIPIQELLNIVAQLDYLVSVDTGIAHIGGVLGIPLIIIAGPTDCELLYKYYDNVQYVSTDADKCDRKPCVNQPCKYVNCLYLIRPREIADAVSWDRVILPQPGTSPPLILKSTYQDAIAFMRLDGLGGTVTLSNHAYKTKQIYDYPITLIIRGYAELFDDNPNVDNIITVGATNWGDCLKAFQNSFMAIADIRFAIPKWYQTCSLFKQDLGELEQMYNSFGLEYMGYHDLVLNSTLHHILMTDKLLGLPHETIESKVYSWSDAKAIKGDYICINNGVDIIHQGQRQTKCWDYWNKFVGLCDVPVVQVGTINDVPIIGTHDMRGKTNIHELCGVLKHAKAIICTEGGIMHLAYALNHPKTIVLRGPTRGKMFEYPGQIMVDSYVCEACTFCKPDWYLRCYTDSDAVCMKTITPERVYETLVTH
jgi:ADP-heptose:LPS heptosyltransferase